MALEPLSTAHANQIAAGTKGRKRGHRFEEELTYALVNLDLNDELLNGRKDNKHLFRGNPAKIAVEYIASNEGIDFDCIDSVSAWWLGGLATSGEGDLLVDDNGKPLSKCKSDVLLSIQHNGEETKCGISVKTCSKATPTNDQIFFTTASAFCELLQRNGILVSIQASDGMSMFCGDRGFQPVDQMSKEELVQRLADPDRFFWEELPESAQQEWEHIFCNYQDEITRLLFQKAYLDDPYPPEYLLHQTVKYDEFDDSSIAMFTIDEIVFLSGKYSGFEQKKYSVHKGRYKDDPGVHLAPRFGFIQFQRGGQKQHPTQLQFNLKSGYFNHLQEIVDF